MIILPESIRQKIDATLHGDAAALGTVFEWFRPRLMAHALRICGNTPAAQDAVQDTFISAFTHLSSLRNAGSFYPWLKRILVNHCYQLLRRELSTESEAALERRDEFIHHSIDKHYETISNRQRLFDSMRQLSEELRVCVMLRYFSDFNSYEQIALLLGIPVGTVRSRLSAARLKLTALFERKMDAGDFALQEAGQWSQFYKDQWTNMYDDMRYRNDLFEHFHPALALRFTSGKTGQGRSLLESEISNDLEFGSRFRVDNVTSSGNISLVEGPNINHPDQPYRCAPSSAFIIFREGNRAMSMQIF